MPKKSQINKDSDVSECCVAEVRHNGLASRLLPGKLIDSHASIRSEACINFLICSVYSTPKLTYSTSK